MNNPFVLKQSEELAKRVLKYEGSDQNSRIAYAYRITLGRDPTDYEQSIVSAYLVDFRRAYEEANQKGNATIAAWTSFCQMLFENGTFRYLY